MADVGEGSSGCGVCGGGRGCEGTGQTVRTVIYRIEFMSLKVSVIRKRQV